MKAVEALLEGESGKALLVVGAPCVGKSTLARDALMAGLRRFGESGAIMTVSGRQIADVIGDQVIRELGATSQARPVTTLSAIAFRLITVMRSRSGEPLPRLLNGAEQDALLRSVCSVHVLMCGRGIHAARARCCANTSPGMIGTACWPMPWPGTTARVVMRIPA